MRALLATVLVAVLVGPGLLASPAAAAGKDRRFAAQVELLGYDAARDVFKVRVIRPGSSGFGGGRGLGADPPDSVKKGDEMELAVVPEGSVLRRTVIKSTEGTSLDTTGTREGFQRAVSLIPRGDKVALSFEENPARKGDAQAPAFVIRMVQLQLTPEEIERRLRELGIEPDEIDLE